MATYSFVPLHQRYINSRQGLKTHCLNHANDRDSLLRPAHLP